MMDLNDMMVRLDADTTPLRRSLLEAERVGQTSLGNLEKMGQRLGSSLTLAAVKGRDLGEVLDRLISSLANTIWKQTVTDPLSDLLGGLFSGGASGLFGRATGGSVSADTPYLVGERGPELFVPATAGRIEPSSATQAQGQSGGGVSVSIQIDARGAEAGTANRLQQVVQEIQSRTFSAVFAAMEQGGRYARMSGRR
jgi:phage-related minor tail protein